MDEKVIKLGESAKVMSGLVVKRKQALHGDEHGSQCHMLTLKSFEPDGWLNTSELEPFKSNEILKSKYFTHEGDVIVRLSKPNTAIAIHKINRTFLVPSLFSIIRIKDKSLLPDYLSIYLNSHKVKRIYARQSIGSALQIISNITLKNIEIPIKTINEQKQIIAIHQLMLKEKQLLEKLHKEKTKQHQAILNKLL